MKICPKCKTKHEKPGKFCSRSCANSRGIMSEEQKEIRRKWALENPGGFVLDKSKCGKRKPKPLIEKVCLSCNKIFKIKNVKREENRKYCSRTCGAGFKVNSTRKTRSVYNGFQMDSNSEKEFAQLLDRCNIKWIKNKTEKFEYKPNKFYYPDFYLPEYNLWVEVKAKYYLREDDNLRWKSVPNHQVIWSDNIKLPEGV